MGVKGELSNKFYGKWVKGGIGRCRGRGTKGGKGPELSVTGLALLF